MQMQIGEKMEKVWKDLEDEEGEEVGVLKLKSRPARIQPPHVAVEDDNGENGENGEDDFSSSIHGNGAGGKEDTKKKALSSSSMYPEEDNGPDSSNGTGPGTFEAVDTSIPEKTLGSKEFGSTVNNSEIETVGNNDENLKGEGPAGLHLLLSENGIAGTTKHVEIHEPLKLIQEDKQEEAEWDVERVLEEQDTHELFCPNCNSCITKRVILRKRKRKVTNLKYDGAKREKGVITSTPLETNASNDQDRNTTEADLTDRRSVPESEGPDLFRCLSCFSFFIPTGFGFRLFRNFRGRGESENVQRGDADMSSVISMPNESRIQPTEDKKMGSREDRKDNIVSTPASVSAQEAKGGVSGFKLFRNFRRGESENVQNPKRGDDAKQHVGAAPVISMPTNDPTMGSHEDKKYAVVSSTPASVLVVKEVKDGAIEKADPPLSYQESTHTETGTAVVMIGEPGEKLSLKPQEDRENPPRTYQEITHPPTGTVPPVQSHDNDHGQVTVSVGQLFEGKQTVSVSFDQGHKLPVETQIEHQDASKNAARGNDVIVSFGGEPDGLENPQMEASNVVRPTTTEIRADVESQRVVEARRSSEWDVLKSIVYGGLVETITSLSVISSAAGGEASTLNIVALGLANLVGGLFVLAHGIKDLTRDGNDRYEIVLGHRRNSCLHAAVAVISYLVFGLVPPLLYGFTFYKSDQKEYKMLAVAAAGLFCVFLLALAKAYTRGPPSHRYVKTLLYFVSIGIGASGLSYVAGVLINMVFEKFGLFQSSLVPSPPVPPSSAFLLMNPSSTSASYSASF